MSDVIQNMSDIFFAASRAGFCTPFPARCLLREGNVLCGFRAKENMAVSDFRYALLVETRFIASVMYEQTCTVKKEKCIKLLKIRYTILAVSTCKLFAIFHNMTSTTLLS